VRATTRREEKDMFTAAWLGLIAMVAMLVGTGTGIVRPPAATTHAVVLITEPPSPTPTPIVPPHPRPPGPPGDGGGGGGSGLCPDGEFLGADNQCHWSHLTPVYY
jgi:hypothetical protein